MDSWIAGLSPSCRPPSLGGGSRWGTCLCPSPSYPWWCGTSLSHPGGLGEGRTPRGHPRPRRVHRPGGWKRTLPPAGQVKPISWVQPFNSSQASVLTLKPKHTGVSGQTQNMKPAKKYNPATFTLCVLGSVMTIYNNISFLGQVTNLKCNLRSMWFRLKETRCKICASINHF